MDAKVQDLVAMVEYQQGSVVSRTLIKKPTGTVTLFGFDQGEALSEHTTPFDALVYVLEGEAAITVSGLTHRVAQGETMTLPANQPHAVRATTRFKMLLVMILS